MKIAIIDYRMGNVKSVANALQAIDVPSFLTKDPQEIRDADAVILPGVGAFRDGIANLQEFGLVEALSKEVKEGGKPLLGICLGMQLLAGGSDEFGEYKGLDFISGWVRLLKPEDKSCKVPHIGWNDLEVVDDKELFAGIPEHPDYYFVHSYHFDAENENDILAYCTHGQRFVSAVRKDNIFGVQFHPEKSQKNGIALLKNFCEFVKSC